MLSLSNGFFRRYFDGMDMVNIGVTPVLQVAEPYVDGPTLSLRDEVGIPSKPCILPTHNKELARTLKVGDRIIVEDFHFSWYRKWKVITLTKFRIFDDHSLPISALSYLPNPISPDTLTEKGVMTDNFTFFPESPKATCAGRKICPQADWLIGRLSASFRNYFTDPINRNLFNHREPVNKVVSQLTGLSINTIRHHTKLVVDDTLPKCFPRSKIRLSRRMMWERAADAVEPFVRDKIRQTIHDHYRRQIPVKIEELIHEVGASLSEDGIRFSPTQKTMQYILKGLGFRFERIRKQNQIYERNDIGEWRVKYLRRMDELRKMEALILYQDETWIYSGTGHKYDWIDKTLEKNPLASFRTYRTTGPTPPKSRGKRCIVIGTVCSEGLLLETFSMFDGGMTDSGDYHKTMSGNLFKEWLKKNIPNFKSVAHGRKIALIIDNAPYHGIRRNAIPTASVRKQEMINFLEKNGKNVDDGLTKKELIGMIDQLVNDRPGEFNIKEIDEICALEGIEVVRLPPYHSELNAIEFVWADLKRKIAEKATTRDRIERIKELGNKILSEMPWNSIKNYCQHVHNVEKEFVRMHNLQLNRRVERFIIPTGDESDEERGDSDEEIEVSDDDLEETDEEEEMRVENIENIDPSPGTSSFNFVPPSPNPNPMKRSCQFPFF